MESHTVRFGWWQEQMNVVNHPGYFSIARAQKANLGLGSHVTHASIYKETIINPDGITVWQSYWEGKGGGVDLLPGAYKAECARDWSGEASASITYTFP